MTRIEVMSGPDRRRRWSDEEKRAILAEAFAPGATVREVSRRVDVVPGQIYRWRRDLAQPAAVVPEAPVGFAEVVVSAPSHAAVEADAPAIEIELSGNIRIRIPAATPRDLACMVVKAVVAR